MTGRGANMKRADLHMHTTYSDGVLAPGRLVRESADMGLDVMAVTDHDTTAGIGEALREAGKHGIRMIPGIEITVRFRREYFTGSLHVLTYFSEILLDDGEFRNDLKETVSGGRGPALVEQRVGSINREFGPHGRQPLLSRELTVREISSLADNISRRHFAMALSDNHGLSRQDVSRLIGNSSPAYVPSGIDLHLLRGFLKRWPVVPVLAHPAAGSFPGDSHYKEVLPPLPTVERLMPEFLEAGLMGLEVYYPGHTPEHVEYLLKLADEMGLVVTGGSDCHDTTERPLMGPGFVGDVSDFLMLMDTLDSSGAEPSTGFSAEGWR